MKKKKEQNHFEVQTSFRRRQDFLNFRDKIGCVHIAKVRSIQTVAPGKGNQSLLLRHRGIIIN